MGLQSSRLYYNGKDHKDIYYNGKYHSAMYFKDQGGYIWRKLTGGSSETSFGIVNSYDEGNYTYYGTNLIYPESREIKSDVVRRYSFYYNSGDECFNKIISGKDRAFGYLDGGSSSYSKNRLWVTSDGRYWKKIYTKERVKYIYPCYNGLVYKSWTDTTHTYKINLDDDNNVISERLISENVALEQPSNNGFWSIIDDEYCFVEHENGLVIHSGISRYDELNNMANNYYFVDDFYNHNVVCYGARDAGARLLKTSGSSIEVLDCTDLFLGNGGTYVRPSINSFYKYNGEFYYWQIGSESVGYDEDWNEIYKSFSILYSTTDFKNKTLVKKWYEDDYIELDIIGGNHGEIDSIRFYPAPNAEPTISGNYRNVVLSGYNTISTPYFIGNTLTQPNGILIEVGLVNVGSMVGESKTTRLGVYLDSWIIDENISGFCYFTANVGVGVSYP